MFDISYEIDLVYYDNTRGTHEVVKGQNYNYLSLLPDSNLKDNQRIRWYKDGTLIQDTTIVENNCTHEIYGKKVAVIPTNSLCKSKEESTYTGNIITLVTQTEGTGYTLSGYNQTNANEEGYEIAATLKAEDDMVWEDGTLGPKTFTCKLYKATPTLTIRAHVPKVAKGDTSYHNLKSNVFYV